MSLRSFARPAALFSFFFFACLLAGTWRGLDAPIGYDPAAPPGELADLVLGWSADRLKSEHPNGGDHIAYLVAAERWLDGGGFTREYMWSWTPGQPLLIAAVLALTGPESYGFKMVAVIAFLWAIAFTFFVLVTPISRSSLVTSLVPLAFLLLPSLRNWTFGFGAVMAEGASCAFFLMAVLALAKGVHTERRRWFLASGALLAAATGFRPFFETVATAIFALPAAVLFVRWRLEAGSVKAMARALFRPMSEGTAARVLFLHFTLAFAVHTVALEPWRIYKHAATGKRAIRSVALKEQLRFLWLDDHEEPGWIHGANPACHVDPPLCASVQERYEDLSGIEIRNLTLRTFFAHPFEWAFLKLRDFDWFWMGRPWSFALRHPLLIVEGFELLALGALGLVLLVRGRERRSPPRVFAIAIAGLLLAHAALFTFFYYEWRYSQPLRIVCFFLPALALFLKTPVRVKSE